MVGIECRQTEHSLAAKTTWKEGQRYVEKKATLHGELANTTWSVGKGSVPRRFLRHAGGKNPVVFFRDDSSHGKQKAQKGILFWRICNPTGLRESICNAVNDRRDCKFLNSSRADSKSARTASMTSALLPSPPVLAGLSSDLSCLRLPFWRICNPTGLRESICNAVNDRRDCKFLNSFIAVR